MDRLSFADLEFLRRLARMPEGQTLVEILRRKLADADARLRTAIGEDLVRSQGRAQLLAELIDDVTKADVKLERVSKPERGPVAGQQPGKRGITGFAPVSPPSIDDAQRHGLMP